MSGIRALVSIHDLMPRTMAQVETILQFLRQAGVPPVTLLVVPGQPWPPEQLDRLRELGAGGHELAAHGWSHHTRPRRLWHRIHSRLVSRDVAEHLALGGADITALMRRSREWFREQDLPEPVLYVPPAWALGPARRRDLEAQPFRLIETTRGLLHLDDRGRRRLQRLPLAGFEADTPWRAHFLRHWNRLQAGAALYRDVPLRIAIHPQDFGLRLAQPLRALLRQPLRVCHYSALSPAQGTPVSDTGVAPDRR